MHRCGAQQGSASLVGTPHRPSGSSPAFLPFLPQHNRDGAQPGAECRHGSAPASPRRCTRKAGKGPPVQGKSTALKQEAGKALPCSSSDSSTLRHRSPWHVSHHINTARSSAPKAQSQGWDAFPIITAFPITGQVGDAPALHPPSGRETWSEVVLLLNEFISLP